jgi:hypothetical protein
MMPFRIKDSEEQLSKWLYNNMRGTLDNPEIFKDKVDTYVVHYPIQKSRSSNIVSVLKTIRFPDNYIEQQDVTFVRDNLLNFIGKNIQINDKAEVISGEPYSEQELKSNMRKITMVTYCAATVIAHRTVNVLHKVASSLYGEKVSQEAMSNIFIGSYGFLPIQDNSLYSGVHFYSNRIDDTGKKEPFVNLNNHELYEKTKCVDKNSPANISQMPDGKNYVVAFNLPTSMTILQNGEFKPFYDNEHGHSMININTQNINDTNNYSYNLFKTVLENSSLGIRGVDVMNMSRHHIANNTITNSALIGRMQMVR